MATKGRIDKETRATTMEEITNFSEILPEKEEKSVLVPGEDVFERLNKRISAENEKVHEIVNSHNESIEIFGEVELNKRDESIPMEEENFELGVNFMDFENLDTLTKDEDKKTEIDTNKDIGLELLMEDDKKIPSSEEMIPENKIDKENLEKIDSDIEEKIETKNDDFFDDLLEPKETVTMEPETSNKVKFEEEKIEEDSLDEELKESDNLASDESDNIFEEEKDELDNLIDEEDEVEQALDELNEEETELLNKLKEEVNKKIKPIDNVVDLNTFTISKKVKKTPNLLLKNAIKQNHCTWIQSESKKSVVMTELTGTEIINLNRANKPMSMSEHAFTLQYLNTIFEHIQSPKPNTMSEWAKVTPSTELDDFFFAIYGAVYGRSNHMFYTCEKNDGGCGNAWMSDNIPLKNLFKTEDENKLKEILSTTPSINKIDKNDLMMVQVTNDWVFALKIPSIYNAYIEGGFLTEADRNKYGNILATMLCIDSIYYINREDHSLEELDFKVADTPEKTTRLRYRQIYKFISSLTPDQDSVLNAGIIKLDNNRSKLISYIVPKTICPKCGRVIKETEVSAEELLFTRHQFGATRI